MFLHSKRKEESKACPHRVKVKGSFGCVSLGCFREKKKRHDEREGKREEGRGRRKRKSRKKHMFASLREKKGAFIYTEVVHVMITFVYLSISLAVVIISFIMTQEHTRDDCCWC